MRVVKSGKVVYFSIFACSPVTLRARENHRRFLPRGPPRMRLPLVGTMMRRLRKGTIYAYSNVDTAPAG